jgi:lipoprotein NlpI
MNLAGARPRIGLALAALFATAAAPVIPEPLPPLLEYASTLHFESMPDEQDLRAQARATRVELEHTAPPVEGCSRTLGASRYAGEYSGLAAAQAALGEHASAADTYARAIACAPRDARLRGSYALELLAAGHYGPARSAAQRGLAIDADNYECAEALAELEFIDGNWSDAAARMHDLAGSVDELELSTYWQIMLWVTQRRAGSAAPQLHARALAATWPRPVLEALRGTKTERQVLAAIEEQRDAQRRREMLCEALFYIAEDDVAHGDEPLAARRWAAAVNLRVVKFTEHQLAVAELRKRQAQPPEHSLAADSRAR